MKIELPLDRTAGAALRRASSGVLAGESVFALLLVFATCEQVYTAELADLAGCHNSYASTFVRRLEQTGLVERVPQQPGMARKYYRRCPSPIWSFVIAWAEDVLGISSGPTVTHLRPRGR